MPFVISSGVEKSQRSLHALCLVEMTGLLSFRAKSRNLMRSLHVGRDDNKGVEMTIKGAR